MIIKFKIFESYISAKEKTLNTILDKIQEFGKDKLTSNELNFLENYPDGELSTETPQDQLDRLGDDLAQQLSEIDFNEEDDDDVKEYDGSYIQGKGISSYSTENFWFELRNTDVDEISNTFIISGGMLFMYKDKKNIAIEGYFTINMETFQTFPYFIGPDNETAYDYAAGHEEEFYDFLEEIYEKNKKE